MIFLGRFEFFNKISFRFNWTRDLWTISKRDAQSFVNWVHENVKELFKNFGVNETKLLGCSWQEKVCQGCHSLKHTNSELALLNIFIRVQLCIGKSIKIFVNSWNR